VVCPGHCVAVDIPIIVIHIDIVVAIMGITVAVVIAVASIVSPVNIAIQRVGRRHSQTEPQTAGKLLTRTGGK